MRLEVRGVKRKKAEGGRKEVREVEEEHGRFGRLSRRVQIAIDRYT